jgi:molybdopterin synthase catalytic subunit
MAASYRSTGGTPSAHAAGSSPFPPDPRSYSCFLAFCFFAFLPFSSTATIAAMSLLIDVSLLDHPVDGRPLEPFPQRAGAECVFLGRTRLEDHPEHGLLEGLRYEAHRGMAEQVLRGLAETAARQYDCLAVRIHHAVGEVPIGAASVLVQVACGHRVQAFDACRFLIDRLKCSAPIWKQEQWADGTTWSPGTPARPPNEHA